MNGIVNGIVNETANESGIEIAIWTVIIDRANADMSHTTNAIATTIADRTKIHAKETRGMYETPATIVTETTGTRGIDTTHEIGTRVITEMYATLAIGTYEMGVTEICGTEIHEMYVT